MKTNILKNHDLSSLPIPRGSWKNANDHFSNALNSDWYNLILKLSGSIAYSTYEYFSEKGFMPALAPVTAQSITSPMGLGSDSLPVSVELFGRQTYLVDSMQFHLEYLLRQHSKGVFYIMPTFRAEDSDARHLNEFFHIEAEIQGDFDENLKTVEDLINKYCQTILHTYADRISAYAGSCLHIENFAELATTKGLPQIKFVEAEKMLGDKESHYVWLDKQRISLTSSAEKEILRKMGTPVWLTDLPAIGVPFYQANSNEKGYSKCADLLMGIGEVVGSGQRHKTAEETMDAIKFRNVDPSSYAWYLRMKKEYPMQTSGFGIGLERLLLWILGHDDIRDTQILVRQKGLLSIP
jgi:asparaginyl-tRNA synthetase